MADTQSILQLGIEAARAGDKAEARELFRLVTREDPRNGQGWLWLAGVAEDREEKRAALERVLEIEPSNELARKGLAALGGARAAAPPAAPRATTTPIATPPPVSTPPASTVDQDTADALDSIDDYAAAPESSRARVYDQPEQVGGYVPPDFGDDYDLSEYQNRPRPADPVAADAGGTTVIVEDEDEPRRRGGGWWLPLLIILGLVAAVLIFFLLFRGNNPASSVATGSGGAAASEVAAGASTDVGAIAGASGEASGAAGQVTGSPEASGAAAASGATAASGEAAGSAAASGEAAASGATTGSPAASGEATGSVAPSGEAATSPAPATSPEASPAPSAPPAASAAPPAASTPPAPADVASANPAVVGNDQVLRAGNFEYSFTGLANVATGSYGGAAPSRGKYLIVLVTVRNVGNAPAQIPDGFFVVKDAQGRTADFNRAASVDYINRFGGTGPRGAGDYAADTQLQPGGQLGSMPLLFDVASDATNIVLFSRDNMSQGFMARQNAR